MIFILGLLVNWGCIISRIEIVICSPSVGRIQPFWINMECFVNTHTCCIFWYRIDSRRKGLYAIQNQINVICNKLLCKHCVGLQMPLQSLIVRSEYFPWLLQEVNGQFYDMESVVHRIRGSGTTAAKGSSNFVNFISPPYIFVWGLRILHDTGIRCLLLHLYFHEWLWHHEQMSIPDQAKRESKTSHPWSCPFSVLNHANIVPFLLGPETVWKRNYALRSSQRWTATVNTTAQNRIVGSGCHICWKNCWGSGTKLRSVGKRTMQLYNVMSKTLDKNCHPFLAKCSREAQ